MDSNGGNESYNVSKEPADFILSASVETTTVIGFQDFSDSNDRILEGDHYDSFPSTKTDEDVIMNANIGTVDSNSADVDLNEFKTNDAVSFVSNSAVDLNKFKTNEEASFVSNGADVDLNEFKTNEEASFVSNGAVDLNKFKTTEGSFVISISKSKNHIGENDVENSMNDNSESLFDSGELENRDNTFSKFAGSNISTQEMATENAATDDFFDDQLNSTNTEHHSVENSVLHNGCEISSPNEDVKSKLSDDTQRNDEDFRTSVPETDESFSIDEILEESECSEKDQTQANTSTDEHLAHDEDSTAIFQAYNSESVILDNDGLTSDGKLESIENASNNESADSVEVDYHSIGEEVVHTDEKTETNSVENDATRCENIGQNFLPIVSCPVSSSTDDVAQKCEVSPEKCTNNFKSPTKENSSETVTNEAESIDSSVVINEIAIESSLSTSEQLENVPIKHLHSSVISVEGGDRCYAAEDSAHTENSVEVPNDDVPSSQEDSVPSGESTNSLPSVSNIQNEEALQANVETAESSNLESSSKELLSNSSPDSPRNLRKRVSSRLRNNSDSSEPTVNDASLPGEKEFSMTIVETRSRTNNHRTPPKSTSRSPSRSSWQPKINEVKSASSNFSIRLAKFGEDALLDSDIKDEVIDESYGIDYTTKERFKLVDFSIKLEKIEVDSDVEILSPPPRTRTTARRSSDNSTSSRSRSRSERSRNRMRSRTATSRSRPNNRRVSKPSATTSSARRPAKNQQLVEKPASTRDAARRSVRRLNGQMAKNDRGNNGLGRGLRSTGTGADGEDDRNRIDFLSLFNLRSRQPNGQQKVKGILVKPKTSKERPKRVSFRLPGEESTSTDKTSPSARGGNSPARPKEDSSKDKSSKSAVKVPASGSAVEHSLPQLQVKVPPLRYFKNDSSPAPVVSTRSASRKRSVPTQSSTKSAPSPKRSRRSSVAKPQESEDEVVDENPFEKLEQTADAAMKTVDVWFECQCCNQKYYLIENAKQHVRTHFPNCLTN